MKCNNCDNKIEIVEDSFFLIDSTMIFVCKECYSLLCEDEINRSSLEKIYWEE